MYTADPDGTTPSFNNARNGGDHNSCPTQGEDPTEALTDFLSQEHRRMLNESGISPEIARERGYFTARSEAELEQLGFEQFQLNVPSLVIPIHAIDGKRHFHRIRPDDPRKDTAKPSRVIKYEQPAGIQVRLDVLPSSRKRVRNGTDRLWIVEGEKKADSLSSRGECAVAVLGVWAWKADGLPLVEWDYVRLIGREVLLAFDSDTWRKVEVRQALLSLSAYLESRKAVVKIVVLPDKPDGAKQGVDDFLTAGGTVEELARLSIPFSGEGPRPAGWPILAQEAYHGLAGEVLCVMEPNTEADPAGLLATLIAVFGNIIGRGAHFVVEGDRHFCKIWVVLVGETGKARKGTGKKRIDNLMRQVDATWPEECNATGLSSGEGVIHRLRDPVYSDMLDEDGRPIVKDGGVEDKRLLVEEPEFASPLTVMQREGNTLSSTVRNAWDNKPLETLTKNSPQKATGTHLTILGHITENELKKHLTEERLGAGIGNRFLFALVRRSKVLPHGGASDVFDEDLLDWLRDAIDFGTQEREVSLAAAVEKGYGYSARELWEEVYPILSSGRPGLFGSVVSRAEAQVRRIAVVYAVLDLSEEVRVPHLLAALALWQYSERSARLIFGDRTGDALADELLDALKDAGETGMTRSDIHDHFGRNQRRSRLGTILRELKEQGRIRKEKEKKDGAGRPTERWFLVEE